ncbi:MAG: hypothetical protein ACFFDI_04800 [Promethearchaeota archaeon]
MKKFTTDRYLKAAFIIGGIYDIILGISSLFFTNFLATLFSVSIPDPLIFPQVTGIFLIVVGYFLIYASQDARKLVFIGMGSCIIRFSFALIVLLTWFTQGIEVFYLLLGITDTLTGFLILLPLLLTEDVSWRQLWQF